MFHILNVCAFWILLASDFITHYMNHEAEHTSRKKSDVNAVYRLSLLRIPLAVRFMCSLLSARIAASRLVFMSIALIMQCGRVSLETSSNEIFSGFFFIFIFALTYSLSPSFHSLVHPSFCSPYNRTYSTLAGMPTSFNTMHKQHTITHKR